MTVRFVLNGEEIDVGAIDPHMTLLEWLRGTGRTGTKEGCAEGECGACAVAWVVRDASGAARYRAVNSCLLPLSAVAGRTVVSVEGVRRQNGELHPVQRALVDHAGSQCGYCTPGFVMSLFAEYYRPERAKARSSSAALDRDVISGNLCRCTGYRPILDALASLPSPKLDEPELLPLARALPSQGAVDEEHAGARFVRPTELERVLTLLEETPSACLIAGGTDLMVKQNQRSERFSTLISLEGVSELVELRSSEGAIEIGAALPLTDLEDALAAEPGLLPMLEQTLPLFASRLIRSRATLGGNLGTASPIGDLAPPLLALDAELELASTRGRRRLPLAEFFLGYRKTALAPGELIRSVRVSRPLPRFQRFYKVSKRVLDDISTLSAAFALELAGDGRVAHFRAAFGGIAATPLRALELERALLGAPWDAASIARALERVPPLGTPLDDVRGSAAYRRALVARLLEKFHWETSQEAR